MTSLYIPNVFSIDDIEFIIRRHFSGLGNIRIITEGTLFLLDFFSQKYLSRQDADGEVKLHNKILRKMVNHRHASRLIEVLIREGVLTKTRNFYPGDHSNTYKFSAGIFEGGFYEINIDTKKSSVFGRGDDYDLDKLLTNENLLVRNTAENLLRLECPKIQDFDLSEKSECQSACWNYALKRFSERRINCTFDHFGRLHSNFTNLPREIRQLVSVGGRRIYCLDIKSCFPTLLWSYVTNSYEKDKYGEWLLSGKFYEQFMDRIGYSSDLRDAFKKQFNAWLNGQSCSEIVDVMKKEFPILLTDIRNLRRKERRLLGHSLMRLESKIMLQTVLYDFWKQFPSAFALPLHDAIYCTAENCDFLRQSIKNAFVYHVGITPRVEVTVGMVKEDKAAA